MLGLRGALLSAFTIVALAAAAPGALAAGADDFQDATPLALATADFDTLTGASGQNNEPDHNGNWDNRSRWYQWTATITGKVTLDTCFSGNDPDTVLAAYTGTTLPNPVAVASNDDGCGAFSFGSRLRFDAVQGTNYHFAVAGRASPQGGGSTYALHFTQTPANDDLANAQVLTGQVASASTPTQGATRQPGEPTHGGNGGRSVWYRWMAPSADPVSVQTCASDFSTLLAVYTAPTTTPGLGDLTLAQTGNNECSLSEAITFTPVSGTTYWFAVDGLDQTVPAGGDYGTATIELASKPANDDFASRQALAGFPVSVSGNNAAATLEGGEPSHGSLGHSIWYSWTAAASGPVAAAACESTTSGPARVDVYMDVNSTLGGLTPLAGDADSCADGLNGRAGFTATAGSTYAIAVSSFLGGPVELELEPDPETDATPPATTITGLKVKSKKRRAVLTFTGSDPATPNGPSLPLSFSCKLDNGAYKPCTSPAIFRRLKPGRHKLAVVAEDASGNEDQSPARKSFRIKRNRH